MESTGSATGKRCGRKRIVIRSIEPILEKRTAVAAGEPEGRLTPEEGLALLECDDLALIGRAADRFTRSLHPESYRTYNIDRNINYTNVCSAVCNFCAF